MVGSREVSFLGPACDFWADAQQQMRERGLEKRARPKDDEKSESLKRSRAWEGGVEKKERERDDPLLSPSSSTSLLCLFFPSSFLPLLLQTDSISQKQELDLLLSHALLSEKRGERRPTPSREHGEFSSASPPRSSLPWTIFFGGLNELTSEFRLRKLQDKMEEELI